MKTVVGWYKASYDGKTNYYQRSAYPNDLVQGQDNPKWVSRRSLGYDAGSAYNMIKGPKVRRSDEVDWYWEKQKNANPANGVYSCRYQGEFPLWTLSFSHPGLDADIVSLQDSAELAFLKKLRGAATPFQALPFLGELKETIGMLRNPFKGIVRHTKAYGRATRLALGSGEKARIVARMINDQYLQYTYGVAPFLNDVEAIMESAKNILFDKQDTPLSVTFRNNFMRPEGVRTAGINASTYPVYVLTWTEVKAKVQIKGSFTNSPHHPLSNRGRENLGLQLDEFIPAAWELLPWSFVYDYFGNIGDILGARGTALTGLRWRWMSTMVKQRRVCVCTPSPAVSLPIKSPKRTPKVAALEWCYFNRSRPPLEVDLQRHFEFQLPDLGQSLNLLSLAFANVKKLEVPRPRSA